MLMVIEPTPDIDPVWPTVYVVEPILKLVTEMLDAGFPEPLSFVNTFPETGVSSAIVTLSSTTIGVLSIVNLATEVVIFPQT